MSDLDDLADAAEQLDRSGHRIDGRGGKHGNKGFIGLRQRAVLASSLASRRKRPITLPKLNLPDLEAE